MRQQLNPNYRMTGMGLVRVPHSRRRMRGSPRTFSMNGLGIAVNSIVRAPYSIGPVPVISQAPQPGSDVLSPIVGGTFLGPRNVQPVGPIVEGGVSYNPGAPTATSPAASTAGSPVPAGYPTNQFYVAADGTLWEYAAAQSQWIPIPSNYAAAAAAAAGATPTTPQVTASLAPAPATSVSVTTPAASSGYSDILTWLQNSTLINGVPNWVIALGGAAVLFKISRPSEGRTR